MRMDDPSGYEWIYQIPEPIKEPAIKDALKHGGNIGIEFREMDNLMAQRKGYKYTQKKVYKFFAVITSQRLPYVLHTQKNIVREMTEKAALLLVKKLENEFGVKMDTVFKTSLGVQDPTKPLSVPTDAQLKGDQPDGGPQRIRELEGGPNEYWEQLADDDKENFEKNKHLWDMMS